MAFLWFDFVVFGEGDSNLMFDLIIILSLMNISLTNLYVSYSIIFKFHILLREHDFVIQNSFRYVLNREIKFGFTLKSMIVRLISSMK